MLLTNHVLTGTIIGLSLENELVIAPVAFSSHFFLDGLPHFGHPKMKSGFRNWRFLLIGGLDFTVAVGIATACCFIWPERALKIAVGAFFAALPDLFYIPEILFKWRLDGKLRVIHSKIQWSETPPGIITEGVWAVAMLYLLKEKL